MSGVLGSQGLPIPKGSRDATALLANADVFAADLSPSVPSTHASKFRVIVAVSAAAVLNVRHSTSGTLVDLNEGQALVADTLYEFGVSVRNGDAVNFQFEAAVTTRIFRVDEIQEGV